MKRREALSKVSMLLGGTVIGAEFFISGCAPTPAPISGLFSVGDVALLDEISETILPKTDTEPGAKDAKVGPFMKMIVEECYTKDQQQIFKNGLSEIDKTCAAQYGNPFIDLSAQQQHDFLLTLEEENKNYANTKKDSDPATHYYRMYKELSLLGFLTSEIACKEAMRYVAIPGRYDGCVPHIEGEKAWART